MDGAFIKLFSLQRSFQFLMFCQDGGDRLDKIDGRKGAEEVCPGLGGGGREKVYLSLSHSSDGPKCPLLFSLPLCRIHTGPVDTGKYGFLLREPPVFSLGKTSEDLGYTL